MVPVPDVDTTELQILSGNLNIDIPDMSKHIQNSLRIQQSIIQSLKPALERLASVQAEMVINELNTQALSAAVQALNDKLLQVAAAISFSTVSDAEKRNCWRTIVNGDGMAGLRTQAQFQNVSMRYQIIAKLHTNKCKCFFQRLIQTACSRCSGKSE